MFIAIVFEELPPGEYLKEFNFPNFWFSRAMGQFGKRVTAGYKVVRI